MTASCMYVFAGAVAGKVAWTKENIFGGVTGVTDVKVKIVKLGLSKGVDRESRMFFL